eukprot:scaffold3851_cov66-Phaeocystis_antarctica.AAC.3
MTHWPSSAGFCTDDEAPLTTLMCSTADGSVSGNNISAPRSKVKYVSLPPAAPPLSSRSWPSPVASCCWRRRTITRGRIFGRCRSPRTPWIWTRSTLGSLSALR